MLEFEAKEVSDEELILREREAEKQELIRLLTTAKDEDRKEIIRNAIAALETSTSGEEPTGTLQTSLSASSLASLVSSRILSAGKVPLDTMSGSGRNRPTSAQRRRPSFTPAFEVVPEVGDVSYTHLSPPSHSPFLLSSPLLPSPPLKNRMLLHRSVDRSREAELSQIDVESVYATCHDPQRPPMSLIPGCASKGIPEVSGSWVSTGYNPQSLFIVLAGRWLVRRVSFRCEGVKRTTLTIDNSGRYMPSQRLGDETFFVFDLTG